MKVEELLLGENVILIDTSALMEVNRLKKFIEKYKDKFWAEKKKIYITKQVWHELWRHYYFSDSERSDKAFKAIEIINKYNKLFVNESYDSKYTKKELLKAFADKDLIMEIFDSKKSYDQILITQDKNLAHDINDLNNQKSFVGKAIYTMKFNEAGDASFIYDESVSENEEPLAASEMVKTIVVEKPQIVYKKPNIKTYWPEVLNGAVSLVALSLVLMGEKYLKNRITQEIRL